MSHGSEQTWLNGSEQTTRLHSSEQTRSKGSEQGCIVLNNKVTWFWTNNKVTLFWTNKVACFWINKVAWFLINKVLWRRGSTVCVHTVEVQHHKHPLGQVNIKLVHTRMITPPPISPTASPWGRCRHHCLLWVVWRHAGGGSPQLPGCPDTRQMPRPTAGWNLSTKSHCKTTNATSDSRLESVKPL